MSKNGLIPAPSCIMALLLSFATSSAAAAKRKASVLDYDESGTVGNVGRSLFSLCGGGGSESEYGHQGR